MTTLLKTTLLVFALLLLREARAKSIGKFYMMYCMYIIYDYHSADPCPLGKVPGCKSLCPATCNDPKPTCIQPFVCMHGCVCPDDKVLDEISKKCVDPSKCPSCPARQVAGCRSLCPATCENPNPTCIQPAVCTYDCVCESGTVYDTHTDQCVDLSQCTAVAN